MTAETVIAPLVLNADTIDEVLLRLLEEAERGSKIAFTVEPADSSPALFPVPDLDPEPVVEAAPEHFPTLGRGPLLGAAAKLMMRWAAGGYEWITEDAFTLEQAEEYWRANRADLEASCNWASRFTNTALMNRSAIATAHLRFSQVNGRESAEAFLEPIGTLVGLQADTGQHTLVHKLEDNLRALAKGKPAVTPSNEDILTMLTRLYVKHLQGKKVSKIGWPEDWTTPAIPRV